MDTTPRRVAGRLLVAAVGLGLVALAVGALPEAGLIAGARAAVVRYGAVWIALSGVVLLGLGLVWRQSPPRRRSAPEPEARPRLTLVTSEPRA
ncbi:hypothetical protein [Nocardioides sp. URHA0020]|uniref:hypothetical protein n=1 Tax=Nocardioides sp. URHA0020 TaxID=1380392 RepID=UPI00048CC2FA|nr:hypothetical protein [Nocardioides sp. URHA0020]